MSRKRFIKTCKKLHKWPAIIIAFIAILFATTGIVMNHRQLFSGISVSRKLLPENYRYNNWNLAAVRGSLAWNNSTLIFGNTGVWKSDDNLQTFTDFNQGFPQGIDNRKIYSMASFSNHFFAGTHMGLYKRRFDERKWKKVPLPVKKERIADVICKDDELLVLTRHYLLKSTNGQQFNTIKLPEPLHYQQKTGLFTTMWQLHSGELFGTPGKLFVDLLGLVTIFLSLSGLLHFFFPKLIKRVKHKHKQKAAFIKTKKRNLSWHNAAGYGFVLFLLINTFAGMHLRPPLLIAIAPKQVGIIPGTHLDSPNPWFDKLRRIYWDEERQQYIFSTSDGFYFAEESLSKNLRPAPLQPPVSVMGCNVLKPIGTHHLMIGSFSGMYLWNLQNGGISNYFSGETYQAPQSMTRPIGANTVSGLVQCKNKSWWFDYSRGAIELNAKNQKSTFGAMPENIRQASPMALWNVALEIHTGRIFEHLVGSFYILFVPLAGVCIMLVLLSGLYLWWKLHRKKPTSAEKK
ncbi:PepSY domain-containing protein [uncultured Draconibacterium sp.]|uniref:PepSY domain-containing protein n=1 Tax=uncultured Draconibacterium sp. TaxID=1573823 RepID=UPI003260D8AA